MGKELGIAAALRVSERSVERWRRQWREVGHAGLASQRSSHLAADSGKYRW
ncbi:helix-turn-helix domain-containing protein [Streptomyces sp. NPDC079020]|uniref:helix-turn-helix domain-containing protein n=1 Tax=Streptomyces sp. NPDC079020 TaxID=3365722 RepID=UPI0037CF0DE0